MHLPGFGAFGDSFNCRSLQFFIISSSLGLIEKTKMRGLSKNDSIFGTDCSIHYFGSHFNRDRTGQLFKGRKYAGPQMAVDFRHFLYQSVWAGFIFCVRQAEKRVGVQNDIISKKIGKKIQAACSG